MLTQPPKMSARPKLAFAKAPLELLTLAQCRQALAAIRSERIFGTLDEDTVWKRHVEGGQKPLADAIFARDAARVHEILATLHHGHVTEGFDQHQRHTRIISESATQQDYHARVIYATLLRCAMALGVVRAFNPEQDENYPYLVEDQADRILKDVRAALGFKAPLPRSVAGAVGLDTPHGLLGHRQAISLGYLREYRDHLARSQRRHSAIVEIGGGIGRTAYNISCDGSTPYVIVDLPVVGFVQYAFLVANGIRCSLWPERIVTDPGHVNIVSAFSLEPLQGLRGALYMNFDAFVEMSRKAVDGYFRIIAETGSDLLSVNHEAARMMLGRAEQNWDIARIAGLGLRASPRGFFWERTGYVAQSFLSPRSPSPQENQPAPARRNRFFPWRR
ncbi:hypothetical protein [Pseudogemmobacter sonorensis]|uniref:hypothetical protein n=1 Tax=Pseudogemmobacter sonorensis TaxID=2989681 RepID=UPI0036820810